MPILLHCRPAPVSPRSHLSRPAHCMTLARGTRFRIFSFGLGNQSCDYTHLTVPTWLHCRTRTGCSNLQCQCFAHSVVKLHTCLHGDLRIIQCLSQIMAINSPASLTDAMQCRYCSQCISSSASNICSKGVVQKLLTSYSVQSTHQPGVHCLSLCNEGGFSSSFCQLRVHQRLLLSQHAVHCSKPCFSQPFCMKLK